MDKLGNGRIGELGSSELGNLEILLGNSSYHKTNIENWNSGAKDLEPGTW